MSNEDYTLQPPAKRPRLEYNSPGKIKKEIWMLPEEILILIFLFCGCQDFERAKPLINVCKTWRRLIPSLVRTMELESHLFKCDFSVGMSSLTEMVKLFKNLEVVSLPHLTDELALELPPTIKELACSDCDTLTNEGLQKISENKNLEIGFLFTIIDGDLNNFECFSNCPKLSTLLLGGIGTNVTVESINTLSNLKVLKLYQTDASWDIEETLQSINCDSVTTLVLPAHRRDYISEDDDEFQFSGSTGSQELSLAIKTCLENNPTIKKLDITGHQLNVEHIQDVLNIYGVNLIEFLCSATNNSIIYNFAFQRPDTDKEWIIDIDVDNQDNL